MIVTRLYKRGNISVRATLRLHGPDLSPTARWELSLEARTRGGQWDDVYALPANYLPPSAVTHADKQRHRAKVALDYISMGKVKEMAQEIIDNLQLPLDMVDIL